MESSIDITTNIIKHLIIKLSGVIIIFEKSYYLIKLNKMYLSYTDIYHLLSHLILIKDGKI